MSETTNIYSCQICDRSFTTFLGLITHLNRWSNCISSLEEYYVKYIKNNNVNNICNNPNCENITPFESMASGYKKHCSSKCAMSNPKRILKIKNTKLKRYQNKNYNNREKCRKTNKLKYNDSFYTNTKKRKSTNIEKFGVEYPFQNDTIQERFNNTIKNFSENKKQKIIQKRKNTCQQKYNHNSPSGDPKIIEKILKSTHKRKLYSFPSGHEVFVQGYEPQALDLLLQYFDESEIIIGATKIPVIDYYFNKKERRYFPDIWIPSINTLVEVKSSWTMENSYDMNIAKHNFSEEVGFDHVFMIL